jgi:hypothetical protein
MESTIALTAGAATMTASGPVTVARRHPRLRSSTLHRLARAMPPTKLGVLVVIEAIGWAVYTRRRLGWRAQGALAKWEHGFTRPRVDRTASSRPIRPR